MAHTIRVGAVAITVAAVGQTVQITLAKGVFVVSQTLTPFEAMELWKAIEEEEVAAFCEWSKNTKGGTL